DLLFLILQEFEYLIGSVISIGLIFILTHFLILWTLFQVLELLDNIIFVLFFILLLLLLLLLFYFRYLLILFLYFLKFLLCDPPVLFLFQQPLVIFTFGFFLDFLKHSIVLDFTGRLFHEFSVKNVFIFGYFIDTFHHVQKNRFIVYGGLQKLSGLRF